MTQPISGAGGAPSTSYVQPGAEGSPGVPSLPPSPSGVDASDVLLKCLPEIGKGALMVAATSMAAPPVAVAGAILAGYETAQCLTEEMAEAEQSAAIRRAIEDCTLRGGVAATAGHQTTCIEFEREP
jgi:hypothetical protein